VVRGADEDQADEEAGQHGDAPEAAAAALHEEDGGNGTDEEGAAADEGHVVGLVLVEADLVHECAHVVHDGVDSSELTQEDHDVGVNDGTASARLGEEVHPGVAGLATGGNDSLLLFSADLHDEELLASSLGRDAADAPPDLESLERLALVHQVARRLGHEQDANTHDGGEDERGTEDVAPVARDTDEHSSDSVAQDFSEGNVELVQ
jgi:hypothetical protein